MKITQIGNPDLPSLVLLHGWGFGSAVWQPILGELEEAFSLLVVDLPGYNGSEADAKSWTLPAIRSALAEKIDQPAIWCGWSLGGMLAVDFAAHCSEKVKAVLSIGANSRFVADETWPNAMEASTYDAFAQMVSEQTPLAMNRFAGLVTQGSTSGRSDMRALKQSLAMQINAAPDVLVASLNLLQQMDTRTAIENLTVPQRHIFAGNDALVPITAAIAMQQLNASTEVIQMPRASHIPWLADPQAVIDQVKSFAAGVSV